MPTPEQERKIKSHMAAINQARKNGASEEEIESLAQDFYRYLVNEGLVQPNE